MQRSSGWEETADAPLIASRALVGIAARSLAGIDQVTLPQYRALVVVASRDVVTVNDLAAALDVHGSSATRLCDRLVEKRLLRRVQASADRRVIELQLTAAGRRIVDRVSERRRNELIAVARRMRPAARASLLAGLAAFNDAAGEPAGIDLLGWSSE